MAKNAKEKTALVLRVCNSELRSHGGFQWPDKIGAVVEAPDWRPTEACGNGLHGWLYGAGDGGVSDYINHPDAKWLVVEIVLSESIDLGGKIKFPRCTIRHIGDKLSATEYLKAHEPNSAGLAVIGGTAIAGNYGTATTGEYGTATAGDGGTATAAYKGTATAGDGGTATAAYKGTATAGDGGTATAAYKGTATAGDGGTAIAGNYGTATAGDGGTAIAGNYGTATAGDGGELHIRYWDAKAERYRTRIAYVGEDGIKPNIKYRLNDEHEFVEA